VHVEDAIDSQRILVKQLGNNGCRGDGVASTVSFMTISSCDGDARGRRRVTYGCR
jgi:hypothetical protein